MDPNLVQTAFSNQESPSIQHNRASFNYDLNKLVNVTRRHAYIMSKVHKQIYLTLFSNASQKKRRNRGILHLICLLSLFLHNCISSYFFLSFSITYPIVKVENGPFISQTTSKKVEAVYSLAMLRFVTGTNMDANRLIIKITPG